MEIGLKNYPMQGQVMGPRPTYAEDTEQPEKLHLRDWLKDAMDDINTAICETKLPDVKLKGLELTVSTMNGHVRIVI